jgi:hypothetical protein
LLVEELVTPAEFAPVLGVAEALGVSAFAGGDKVLAEGV